MASSNRTHTRPTNRGEPTAARTAGARGEPKALRAAKRTAGAGKAGSTVRTRLAKPAPKTVSPRKKPSRAPADVTQREYKKARPHATVEVSRPLAHKARSTAPAEAARLPTRKARSPSPAEAPASSLLRKTRARKPAKVPASSPAREPAARVGGGARAGAAPAAVPSSQSRRMLDVVVVNGILNIVRGLGVSMPDEDAARKTAYQTFIFLATRELNLTELAPGSTPPRDPTVVTEMYLDVLKDASLNKDRVAEIFKDLQEGRVPKSNPLALIPPPPFYSTLLLNERMKKVTLPSVQSVLPSGLRTLNEVDRMKEEVQQAVASRKTWTNVFRVGIAGLWVGAASIVAGAAMFFGSVPLLASVTPYAPWFMLGGLVGLGFGFLASHANSKRFDSNVIATRRGAVLDAFEAVRRKKLFDDKNAVEYDAAFHAVDNVLSRNSPMTEDQLVASFELEFHYMLEDSVRRVVYNINSATLQVPLQPQLFAEVWARLTYMANQSKKNHEPKNYPKNLNSFLSDQKNMRKVVETIKTEFEKQRAEELRQFGFAPT